VKRGDVFKRCATAGCSVLLKLYELSVDGRFTLINLQPFVSGKRNSTCDGRERDRDRVAVCVVSNFVDGVVVSQ